jgi:hypothetical protein
MTMLDRTNIGSPGSAWSLPHALRAGAVARGSQTMEWTTLNFGKHNGKTLPQVMFADPDWFFWAYEEGVFRGSLAEEAEEVYRKACSIRVPSGAILNEQEVVVEYYIHTPTGKFAKFELVPASRPSHLGSSPAFRSKAIDLSVPRRITPYDKLGGSSMISKLKYYLFGDSSYRMTRRRCEEFFEDDANFDG